MKPNHNAGHFVIHATYFKIIYTVFLQCYYCIRGGKMRKTIILLIIEKILVVLLHVPAEALKLDPRRVERAYSVIIELKPLPHVWPLPILLDIRIVVPGIGGT